MSEDDLDGPQMVYSPEMTRHMLFSMATAALFVPLMALAEEYPEVKTSVHHVPNNNASIFVALVDGVTLEARENSPPCLPSLRGSTCRRMCGSLPRGRKFVSIESAQTGDFTTIVGEEVYSDKTPERVCFKVKNWASLTPKWFTIVAKHDPK